MNALDTRTRYKILVEKFAKEGKILDLSRLPTCKASLQLRANCDVCIFRRSNCLKLDLDKYAKKNWEEKGRTVWSDLCYL